MHCEGFAPELYSDYLLGTLDTPETLELNSHLERDCVRCAFELRLSRGVWYGIGLAAPVAEPPRGLRQRVIASVQPVRTSGFQLLWWQPLVGLAALAMAVVIGWQVSGLRRAAAPVAQSTPNLSPNSQALANLTRENQILRDRLASQRLAIPLPVVPRQPSSAVQSNSAYLAEIAQAQQQIAVAEQELIQQKALASAAERARQDAEQARDRALASLAEPRPEIAETQRQLASAQVRTQQLEHDLTEYKSLLATARQRANPTQTADLLADPNVRLVRLRGTERASGVEGHALVSGSQLVFYGFQLPPLPAGRAYQLWLIRASSPAIVSAGVFQPNGNKAAVVQFDNRPLLSGITTMAVTDEPIGGSAAPTGHKVLIGI